MDNKNNSIPPQEDDLAAIQIWLRQHAKFLGSYILLAVTILISSGRFSQHFQNSFADGSLSIGTLFSLSGIAGLIGACCFLAYTLTQSYLKSQQNPEGEALGRWLPWYILEPIVGWLGGYIACGFILFLLSTIAGDALTLTSTISFPKFLIIMAFSGISGVKGTSLLKLFETSTPTDHTIADRQRPGHSLWSLLGRHAEPPSPALDRQEIKEMIATIVQQSLQNSQAKDQGPDSIIATPHPSIGEAEPKNTDFDQSIEQVA